MKMLGVILQEEATDLAWCTSKITQYWKVFGDPSRGWGERERGGGGGV